MEKKVDTKELGVSLGNIYCRIAKIAKEIGTIEKKLLVGKGTTAYKAIADTDVVRAVKKAENKYRVISVPAGLEVLESKEVKVLNASGNEDVYFCDLIKTKWEIINLDKPSDKITVESVARGIDYGDKGLGKAMTYARKYALLNAYKIAASAEDDLDTTKSEKKVAKKPEDMKIALSNYIADKPEDMRCICSSFGVESLEELSEKDLKSVYTTYRKKYGI